MVPLVLAGIVTSTLILPPSVFQPDRTMPYRVINSARAHVRPSQQNRSAWMIRPASALQNGGLFPILTYSPAFPMIFTMKTMFQVGLNGQVSVPPEKRFLIHLIWHRCCYRPASGTPNAATCLSVKVASWLSGRGRSRPCGCRESGGEYEMPYPSAGRCR